jgi:hypothetical protein
MVEEMLWNDNGGPFATTRVIFADQGGSERSPPDDIPEILHGFGERAGGYKTGISVYPQAALEPHVIDTFGGIDPFPSSSDTYAAAARAATVVSIERAIGTLPIFVGPNSKPTEYVYVHELRFQDGSVRRKVHCPMHQMLGIGKNIQGTAEEARADGTNLLLQIDSDWSVHSISCSATWAPRTSGSSRPIWRRRDSTKHGGPPKAVEVGLQARSERSVFHSERSSE